MSGSHSKKQQHLHTKNIDEWFAHKAHEIQLELTKDQNTKSPLLANQLMGRYGLRNSKELLDFLKSPGGKSLKSLIARKLAELEALRQNGIKTAEEKKHERALMMVILGLAYQKKADAAERLGEILEQKQLNNRLHPKKPPVQEESIRLAVRTESLLAYTATETALKDTLKSKHALRATLDAEWDDLEIAFEAQKMRHAFFDDLLLDVTRIFALLPDEEMHVAHLFEKPELKNTFKENQIIHKDGKTYLIAKGVSLDSLSPEDLATAEKAYLALKPRLEKVIKSSQKDETAYYEKRKNNLIHRFTRLHEDIRVVTQQLALIREAIIALEAKPKPQLNQDTAPLTASYRTLLKSMQATSSTKQRAPILSAVHEDIDSLNLDPRMNQAGMPSPEAPRLLAELHRFQQGANNITSAAHTQTQTLISMLKNAPTLAALMSEAPTSRRFNIAEQLDEQNYTPQRQQQPEPQQQPTPQQRPENRPENTHEPRFRPTPFSTDPFQ